ncbi:MAG TPA: CDP-glucose 4,6-dehydratase, partial [Steroidobacteraceae bacterium]|nr:CDP-glucose 4,6-dehydratase [Steroidobacteraceae bacterium]
TFATNALGTAHLLQACRGQESLRGIVVITSDKVYENDGDGRAFEEGDRLGGRDPYSASKACAELVAASYRASYFEDGPPIATARAGNVIGGGDRSPDRLIPDCLRALEAGEPVTLRYPRANRPWQHVLDPLAGYLRLAEVLVGEPGRAPRSVNFGPDPVSNRSVAEVVDAFSACFGGKPGWRVDPYPQPPEAATLRLSSDLARRELGWRPRLDFEATLAWTAEWHRAMRAGEDMARCTRAQIENYGRLAPIDGRAR